MMRFLRLGVLCLGVLFAACSGSSSKQEGPVAVTGVSLSKASLALEVGQEETLVATVVPSDAANKNVLWASNNPAVASVSAGKITALAAGTATVTATASDGGAKGSCTVMVISIPVESVSIDKTSIALAAGASETIKATVLPEKATNKTVIWTSSNPGVATVSEGKVTGVATGTATITAASEDGNKTAVCTVRVIAPVTVAYLTGEWKLTELAGSTAMAGKVYLKFNADKSFVMYQNMNQAGYTKYTGTFQYDAVQNLLSGTYSDGVAWKRSYTVGKVTENRMMFFDRQDAVDTSDYAREAIPDYVKSPAAAAPTRAEERFL